MLNRTALTVSIAQPYIDWAKSLPDADHILPSMGGEKTVFLIQQIENDAQFETVLKKLYAQIFEFKLNSWCLDESLWPQNRTLTMFQDWLTVHYHTVVIDLLDAPLKDDGF
jgi:hypothetical protein